MTTACRLCNTESMVYQAIWAPTADFDEVLISRKMLRDHSPYIMLDALNKVWYSGGVILCVNVSGEMLNFSYRLGINFWCDLSVVINMCC